MIKCDPLSVNKLWGTGGLTITKGTRLALTHQKILVFSVISHCFPKNFSLMVNNNDNRWIHAHMRNTMNLENICMYTPVTIFIISIYDVYQII